MTKREAAMEVIEQFKRGEWAFQWNPRIFRAITATRKGAELWCGNGGFFTDINKANCFGFFWRHVVWWRGVRPALKKFKQDRLTQAPKNTFPTKEWWR